MGIQLVSYNDVRRHMRSGDVIAFGGKSGFSEIIKSFTRSVVSHVAVVLQTRATYDSPDDGRYFNDIVEATKFERFVGVGRIRLSDRLMHYEGEAWWLPLNRGRYESSFDVGAFFDFLYDQEGKGYSVKEAALSAMDALDGILGKYSPTFGREDFSSFFCSELVAASLEASGMVGAVNASEVTPIDLCLWNIFEDNYCQIYCGDSLPEQKEIPMFNTQDPAKWNV